MFREATLSCSWTFQNWARQCIEYLQDAMRAMQWMPPPFYQWLFEVASFAPEVPAPFFELQSKASLIHFWTPRECGIFFSQVISSTPLSSSQHCECRKKNNFGTSLRGWYSDSARQFWVASVKSLILAFQPSDSLQLKSPPTQAALSLGIWHVQDPHDPCPVIELFIQSSQKDELQRPLWALLVSHQGLWKMWYAVHTGHSTTCSTEKRLQTRTCYSFEHINLHRHRHPPLTGDRRCSLHFSSNLKTKQESYSPRKGVLISSSTVPH